MFKVDDSRLGRAMAPHIVRVDDPVASTSRAACLKSVPTAHIAKLNLRLTPDHYVLVTFPHDLKAMLKATRESIARTGQ